MRSKFIPYTLLLVAAILDSASGSLLRGDEAVRSPRVLEKNIESDELEKVGKKNNESQPKGSKKSKRNREETEGNEPPTLVGPAEKEAKKMVRSPDSKAVSVENGARDTHVEQIVHSHHPKAASDKEITHKEPEQIIQSHHPNGTGAEKGASKKDDKEPESQRKHSKKQRGKDETADDDSKEQEEVESENENTDTNQRVQSRGYETLNQSLDAKDRLSTIVGRPIEVFAIEYSTTSDKLPTEVESLYLVHLTEHFLSSMYSRTFESTATVHYDGMEVHNYKSVAPRMIQFEITTLFQQEEGMVVPSSDQVKEVVQQDLAQSGVFYSEYLATLTQMPFEVFSTTTSFRVVTDADELQRLIDATSDEADKPRTFLIVAAIIAGFSVSICAIAKCRGAKIARMKSLKEHGTGDISQAIEHYKTATFDDPIADGAYFDDEPDVENTVVRDMVEVDLNDDHSSADSREWTSSDDSFEMPFRDKDEQLSTSDESQASRNSVSERSLGSGIWTTNTLKSVEPSASAERSPKPGNDSKCIEVELPESAETVRECGSRSLPMHHESLVENADSIMLPRIESFEEQRPTWTARRLRQLTPTKSDEAKCPDELPVTKQPGSKENSGVMQGSSITVDNPSTTDERVPLWMKKRQEIMERRQQQPVHSESGKPWVESPAIQSRLEDVSVSDVVNPRETNDPAADLSTTSMDHMNPTVDTFLSKAEAKPHSTISHVPLWMKKRQESMQQREQQRKQETMLKELEKYLVETFAVQSVSKDPTADVSIVEETDDPVSPVNSKMDTIEPRPDSVGSTNATRGQITGGPENPVSLKFELRPDEPAPASALSASNGSIVKGATYAVSPTHSKLGSDDVTPDAVQLQSSSEQIPFTATTDQVNCVLSELYLDEPSAVPAAHTNAAIVDKLVKIEEADLSTNVEKMPLWVKKRREISQESARQCEQQLLQIDAEQSILQQEEEGIDPVSLEQSERSMAEPASSTNDKDVPLWMKKRQEILLRNEEESVHEDELDEASINGAPAWMTRFKEMDRN